MNTNTTTNNPLNFPFQLEYGANQMPYYWPPPQVFDYYYWSPPQVLDDYCTTRYFGADFQFFKKPGISEPMLNSSSRMSLSSTSGSSEARPINAMSQPRLPYKSGYWNSGANYVFSHDEAADARELQNSDKGVVVVGDQIRTNCWFSVYGKECPHGNRCNYFHLSVRDDKGGFRVPKFRETAAITVLSTKTGGYRKQFGQLERKRFMDLNSDGASQKKQKAEPLKTRLCDKWEKDGSCPSGEKCKYAHGFTELRKFDFFPSLESGESLLAENVAGDVEDAGMKEIRTADKQQKHKKWLIKWNNVKKISHVYADWIESMPHVPPGNL